jgi:endogenous inhibitor of DNA gyrase (YacG/DUF329 family)
MLMSSCDGELRDIFDESNDPICRVCDRSRVHTDVPVSGPYCSHECREIDNERRAADE